jgi:hypothetical protein
MSRTERSSRLHTIPCAKALVETSVRHSRDCSCTRGSRHSPDDRTPTFVDRKGESPPLKPQLECPTILLSASPRRCLYHQSTFQKSTSKVTRQCNSRQFETILTHIVQPTSRHRHHGLRRLKRGFSPQQRRPSQARGQRRCCPRCLRWNYTAATAPAEWRGEEDSESRQKSGTAEHACRMIIVGEGKRSTCGAHPVVAARGLFSLYQKMSD